MCHYHISKYFSFKHFFLQLAVHQLLIQIYFNLLGTTFKAHRLVLAACSSHFQNLFSNAPVTATHTQLFVILDGTRADDLQILLQFMYKGEAYLHEDRIDSVIRTAELLQIKGLCESPKNIVLNDNTNLRGNSSLGKFFERELSLLSRAPSRE